MGRCARRKLLALNPNNQCYHEGLQAALQLAPDAQGCWSGAQRAGLRELYAGLAAEYPRAQAVLRLPLDFKVRRAGLRAACLYCVCWPTGCW